MALPLVVLALTACKTPGASPMPGEPGNSTVADPACVALPPDLPAALHAPPAYRPAIQVFARGTQNYRCVVVDGGAAWSAAVPEAILYQGRQCGADGGAVGTHFAGPTWQWTADSSTFVGGKGPGFAALPSPDDAGFDAPWLLLPRRGGTDAGVMGPIRFAQRIHTAGGAVTNQAAACDPGAADAGLVVKVPYSATYILYRSAE